MIRHIRLAAVFLLALFSILVASCQGSIRVEKEIVYVDRPVEIVKEVVKEVEVIKEVVREVEVEVIKPVYHTVQVEVPIFIELEDWESIDELMAFLEEDDTDRRVILVAGSDGVVKLYDQCEDAAIQLMNNAMAVGKRLSFVPLHPNEYLKWYGSYPGADRYHAICGALVGGNEFYYIEPNEDRVWLAQYLD